MPLDEAIAPSLRACYVRNSSKTARIQPGDSNLAQEAVSVEPVAMFVSRKEVDPCR